MQFVKGYKRTNCFYCDAETFSNNSKTGISVSMNDDFGNVIHVIPSGFHNFSNLFYIEDLLYANVFNAEISKIYKLRKSKGDENDDDKHD